MALARGTRHERPARALRAAAADTLVRRARHVLGSVARPTRARTLPWTALPDDAQRVELAVEETLEHAAPGAFGEARAVLHEDLWMDCETRRAPGLVLCLDTSLSMQGAKLALLGVAAAVVLLQFPDDPVGVVDFDEQPRALKRPDERLDARALVERLLDAPGRPRTNLEGGLRAALDMERAAGPRARGARGPSTLLVTDGRATVGADPAPVAERFSHLVVLRVGEGDSGEETCRELARRGHGRVRHVPRLEALPGVLYEAVQEMLRGRA
jgi:Mg-chelatase subunit ChlD